MMRILSGWMLEFSVRNLYFCRMSTPFLEKTAQHLLETYGSDLSGICVVMPNRRAGLFLRKFLAARLSKPVWSPVVFSIEDFMATLSGLTAVEPVHLLIDLYDIHRVLEQEKAQPFDEFMNWGPQLLADFNEIDRYLADADALFGYLSEVRAINLWNLDKTPLTDFQRNYLKFYQSLSGYYQKLTELLTSRGNGYQGLIFRHAAGRLIAGEVSVAWTKVVFAGFNALTTAEEKVMHFLHELGKAEFLWDADRYYLDQGHQEAGTFLRKWLNSWPLKDKNWISNDYLEGVKKIEVIGVPDQAGQVKLCGELLGMPGMRLDSGTAIVLPDERMLLPLLNSLPAGIDELNVTMGLPLKQTPLADLLDLLFQSHLHAMAMKKGSTDEQGFYYRDVLRLLQHPLMSKIAVSAMNGNQFALSDLIGRIRKGNQVFIRKRDLHGNDLFDSGFSFLDLFFNRWNQPEDAIRDLRGAVALVRDAFAGPPREVSNPVQNQVEPEYAYAFTKIINQLNDIVVNRPGYFTWQAFYRFFHQLTEGSALPFYGEPLQGVQVMGMLETRTLDFDTVILLSCNEGMLPSGKTTHSFIPFDIKREFGLPTYHQQDAVYAYHFYRLLQRARKVWLLYNTEPDQLGGGEKSRYIQQIIRELPLYNPGISITARFLLSPLPKGALNPPIIIAKTDGILEKLLKKASDGFAPTALNAYRKCTLRFCFSELAGLREPDEAADTIDPKTLGIAVHEALFLLFEPHKGKVISPEQLPEMMKTSDALLDRIFAEKYSEVSIRYGKNHLLVNVARILLRNYLKQEADALASMREAGQTRTVVLLEQHLRRMLKIQWQGQEMEVLIKGVVDRMDRMGDEIRVIDYKTGLSENRELLVKDWDDLLDEPMLDKAFQLLTYAWLLNEQPRPVVTRAGIISLKKLGSGFMTVHIPAEGEPKPSDKLRPEDIDQYEAILQQLIGSIFNTEEPFRQTDNEDTCLNCPYAAICGR
jgi:hypothetical protein